jgi:CrcB protein
VPWATFAVNVIGSFVLGVVLGLLPPGSGARLLLGTGFCGGFTTFSTFSAEVVAIAEGGAAGRAGAYAVGSVAAGLAAAVAGAAIGRAAARGG